MQCPSPLVPTDSITTAALIHNHRTFLKPSLRALMSNRPGFSRDERLNKMEADVLKGRRGRAPAAVQYETPGKLRLCYWGLPNGHFASFSLLYYLSSPNGLFISIGNGFYRSAVHLHKAVTLSCRRFFLSPIKCGTCRPSKHATFIPSGNRWAGICKWGVLGSVSNLSKLPHSLLFAYSKQLLSKLASWSKWNMLGDWNGNKFVNSLSCVYIER